MFFNQKRFLFNALAFIVFAPDDGAGSGGSGGSGSGSGAGEGNGAGEGGTPNPGNTQTWDKVYEGLDESSKKLFDDHTTGLKSALESEREQRKNYEKQIAELKSKAEKGSEMEKSLADIEAKLAESNLRAEFAEEGAKLGVNNLKLAFLAAKEGEFIDGRGRINWEGLKKEHPQLFGEKPKQGGDAGSGTGTPAPAGDMNQAIRNAAGRG